MLGAIFGVLALGLTLEKPAAACGGTFCDGGPTSAPVDQTGENILFVMDGKFVEAHIQIQYSGDAHSFAWVIPVPAVPEISVGSQPLFTNLLNGTVPTYGFNVSFDTCTQGLFSQSGAFANEGPVAGGAGGSDPGTDHGGGGPKVVYERAIGAFDVTVLSGGTAKEVSDWLTTNGYATTATTPKLLKTYTDKSYVFVAVKLLGESGVNEIHPLVVRYPGNMPCVPLVLTAEASVDNMGVRAFFLGDDRVFPENYGTVELNEARIDWLNTGSNYDAVVARAVAEAPKHHGFVTEYAGTSAAVSRVGIYSSLWNAAPFKSIAPKNVVTELEKQGLATCSPQCKWKHPLLIGLLHEYLPPAKGFTDSGWYGDLPAHASAIDQTVWNGAAFASDFAARIVQPGFQAQSALSSYPYLTRMFTRISPPDMNDDPTFSAHPELSDEFVSQIHMATLRNTCSGKRIMILPDGTEIAMGRGGNWPTFSSEMPWAQEVESVPAEGKPVVLSDNTSTISDEITNWNHAHGWPEGCSCSMLPMLPGKTNGLIGFAFCASALVLGLRRRR